MLWSLLVDCLYPERIFFVLVGKVINGVNLHAVCEDFKVKMRLVGYLIVRRVPYISDDFSGGYGLALRDIQLVGGFEYLVTNPPLWVISTVCPSERSV